jgi:hypothetical protein
MSYIGRQLNVPASVFEAVADGSITAGSTVVIKSTGKVANATDQSASNSTPANVTGNRLVNFDAAYDAGQNCVLLCYRDTQNSNKVCIRAATLSGSTLTFGTQVVTDMITDSRINIASDGSGGFILIAKDTNQSNKQYALAGTVSGTTISTGSEAEFADSTYGIHDVTFDSTSGKFVIVYIDNQNSFYLTAKVATRSGTSFSLGTAVVANSDTYTDVCRCTEDTDENRIVVFADSVTKCIAGAVSGTSTSWGSSVTISGTEPLSDSTENTAEVTYDSSAKATVFLYSDDGTSPSKNACAIVVTLSGSTVTAGSRQVLYSADKARNVSGVYDALAQKVLVVFDKGADGQARTGQFLTATITGGTSRSATASSITQFESSQTSMPIVVHHTAEGKNIIAYSDEGDSDLGKYVVQASFFQNYTDFIGFTDTSYDDGDLVKVQVGGSVNDLQSSLTAGQTYFVQTNGTIGLTAASTSVTAGTAVSATEILVKG